VKALSFRVMGRECRNESVTPIARHDVLSASSRHAVVAGSAMRDYGSIGVCPGTNVPLTPEPSVHAEVRGSAKAITLYADAAHRFDVPSEIYLASWKFVCLKLEGVGVMLVHCTVSRWHRADLAVRFGLLLSRQDSCGVANS